MIAHETAKEPGVWLQSVPGETAFVRAQQRFGSELASIQYPAGYRSDLKGTLERRAVLAMLDELPPGGHILDCPCGTGRVMQLLLDRQFRVTAADCSEHMVERCRNNMLSANSHLSGRMTFGVEDVLATSYADASFDGVICNRLLHHYDDGATRVAVLRELARVSRGPVIVSFTDALSVSATRKRVKARLLRRTCSKLPTRAQLAREFAAAGMTCIRTVPVMWGLSRMCYMAGMPKR